MAGRSFSLARNSPLRTTLIDEATGQAVYEISTPRWLSSSYATKIRKLEPTTQPHLPSDDDDDDNDDDITDKKDGLTGKEEDEPLTELPETSDEIARIYWRFFTDKIVFRGKITTRSEFLPRCGKLKGSYKFTGPDGVEYRWAMGAMGTDYPKLVTADENKTVIAKFHRAHHFLKKKRARLEVQPAGMEMLDYIILTFVIVENKRREQERAIATSTA